MSTFANASGQARRFTSLAAYNQAYPQAQMPMDADQRGSLRRFDAGGVGIEDDLIDRGALLSVDFLPGGAPKGDELDRIGTVVTSRWGQGPVTVLAEAVSLRAAWRTISAQWPTTLSGVRSALADVRHYTGTP